MNGKITGIKGKFIDREFPLDQKRGVALAAPGGKRVEITYSGKNNAFILISREYPVPVNGNPTKHTALASGDIFVLGASEFRFEIPKPEKDATGALMPVDADKPGTEVIQPLKSTEEKDRTDQMKPVESEKIAEQAAALNPKESPAEELDPGDSGTNDRTDVLIPIPEEVKQRKRETNRRDEGTRVKQSADKGKKDGTEMLMPAVPGRNKAPQKEKSDTRVKSGAAGNEPPSNETTVADLEFCDVCGTPLIEFAFKTGEAVRADGKFFCRECRPKDGTEALQPIEKPGTVPTPARKPAPAEKNQMQRKPARRAPAPKRGAAAGGRAARMMRQRTRKRMQAPGDSEITNTPQKAVKPPVREIKQVDKGAGTEPLEPENEKKSVTDPLLPVPKRTLIKKEIPAAEPAAEDRKPEASSESPTDGVETVRRETAPVKPARKSREEKTEKPKGPGLAARTGKLFKSAGIGIFLIFKYIFLACTAVFLFIRKRFRIWRLNKRMNSHLKEIGSALREKRNQTAFISEELALTAAKLKELPEDSDEKKQLILQLGEQFLRDYSENQDPAGIGRMLKTTDSVENELKKVKGGLSDSEKEHEPAKETDVSEEDEENGFEPEQEDEGEKYLNPDSSDDDAEDSQSEESKQEGHPAEPEQEEDPLSAEETEDEGLIDFPPKPGNSE